MRGKLLKVDRRPWKVVLESVAYPVLFFGLGTLIFKGIPSWQAYLSAVGFWLLRGIVLAVRDFKRLWRVEQSRQAAAKHAQWVPLASPQPTPDAAALSLPCVIFSRCGWLSYLLIPIFTWVLLVLVFLWFWSSYGPFVDKLLFSAYLAVPLSIIWLADYPRVEVREEGLTIRTLFSRRSILWQDARVFAIDATKQPHKDPDHYELSSATTILRWSRDLKPSRLARLSSSFPEYTQQMDALLALICARTGLPLYDLRDWGSQKELPPEYLPPPIPQYPPPFSPDASQPDVRTMP